VGKGLSDEPRGLNLEIIFYYCFKKICASYGFILSPFGRTRDFPSGGRKACGWNACSSQGDKCQPWCMQIKQTK
jgi:hypothetical protein